MKSEKLQFFTFSFSLFTNKTMAEKQKIPTLQLICLAIGVTTGLIIMRFVFNQTGAIAGAIGGGGGAFLGIVLYALIVKIKG